MKEDQRKVTSGKGALNKAKWFTPRLQQLEEYIAWAFPKSRFKNDWVGSLLYTSDFLAVQTWYLDQQA